MSNEKPQQRSATRKAWGSLLLLLPLSVPLFGSGCAAEIIIISRPCPSMSSAAIDALGAGEGHPAVTAYLDRLAVHCRAIKLENGDASWPLLEKN